MAYLEAIKMFTLIYVIICTNIQSIADDISMSVTQLNMKIDKKISMKTELLQIVQLHLHCYKQAKFILLETAQICEQTNEILFYLNLSRVLELLESIIRIPIFYQISIFALQLSIFLYVIEVVSIVR